MGIKQLREEEKGSGLVLTLMVLLVLSVLGIAIGTLTIGSYRLSDATRDDTSAYYVAEAGAVAAYEQIQREVLSAYKNNETEGAFYNQVSTILSSKNGQSSIKFDQQLGSEPTATIRTEKEDSQNYNIQSTGEIDGKERTVMKKVTVNWVNKSTGGGGMPKLPENAALLTQGGMELRNGTLVGDLHTNSVLKDSVKISGGKNSKGDTLYYPSSTTAENLINREYDWKWIKNYVAREKNIDFKVYENLLKQVKVPTDNTIDFKKLPDKIIKKNENEQYKVQDNGNLFLNNYLLNTYKLEVYDNISFNKIIVESGKKLTIDPMGGNHTILVNDLSISSGDIDIVGKGTITFLVNNLSISSGSLNVVEEGKITFLVNNLIFTSSNLDIIGEGIIRLVVANTINFNQNSYINASGISKQFLLIFTGPNPNFTNINKMNANVISIGNEKPVDLNNTTINGVFLTDNKEIILSGGNWNRPSNVILIAPKSAVTLTGSYLMNGTVIAEKFKMLGDAKLTYTKIVTTGFPFGSSVTVTAPSSEDIITSGTIIED